MVSNTHNDSDCHDDCEVDGNDYDVPYFEIDELFHHSVVGTRVASDFERICTE
jgi:hypothetical protein